MKIGRSAGPRPVEQYFEETQAIGLHYLELGCQAPPNFPQTFDDERINKIKDLREKYGIPYNVHSGSYVNSAEMMPTVRLASEQHLIEYIQLAAKLEAENLVIHLGFHFSQYMEDTYAALLKTYSAVVKEAERLKMPLVIENMNLLSPDAEIRYLGVTVEEMKVVLDAFETPYLGLALDVGHANQLPGGVDAFIDAFGPRIGDLHLHDNDGVYDRHWAVGKGTVDWKHLFGRLKEIGYKGNGTIELRNPDDVLESKNHLQKIGILPQS